MRTGLPDDPHLRHPDGPYTQTCNADPATQPRGGTAPPEWPDGRPSPSQRRPGARPGTRASSGRKGRGAATAR
ncbi:hypothetical protein GCM10017562_03320 [Streptomyces roseofulvus]